MSTLNFVRFRHARPHLNGKVDRSQLTDLTEFWSLHETAEEAIGQRIEEWKFEYNWRRPYGPLGGRTPIDRVAEMIESTPLSEEVERAYNELESYK